MESKGISFTVFKGSQSGGIVQSETSRPPLTGDQVLVSVTASGLCGGDLIFKGNDVRPSLFPISQQALTEAPRWFSATRALAS